MVGWWQNGQFGEIRLDPCPALQPITIQYPRITHEISSSPGWKGSKTEAKYYDKESGFYGFGQKMDLQDL